ncbi:MAG: DNA polymerase I [Candidatus Eutrophobiaceae bacterium]
MKSPDLVLVDGSYYLFRAWHSMRSAGLKNAKGIPTGAIFGVINMLKSLRAKHNSRHFAVIFDPPGKNFRHELYPEYKAHRPDMPDELRCQIAPLHELIQAQGLPLLCISGTEADDVIGTLAIEANDKGMDTLISTGDKDLAQLVGPRIALLNTMSGELLDRQGVINKFGVPPELIVDYLTLMGDTSDNVPGVPKVGPKTAAKWLREYGTLDVLVERAAEIKGAVGASLREHIADLALSRKLVTLKTNLELDCAVEELAPAENIDEERLLALYRHWNFNSWAQMLAARMKQPDDAPKIVTAATPPPTSPSHPELLPCAFNYDVILDQATFDAWLERLRTAEIIYLDTETTSLNAMTAQLVGISFATSLERSAYLPLAHQYIGAPEQLDRAAALEQIKPLLEDPKLSKTGHHIKYDAHVLAHYGIELHGIAHDTMLESYIADSGRQMRHDMDSLAAKWLGYKTISYDEVAGKGKKQISFSAVEIAAAGRYAAEDAHVTCALHQAIYPHIQKEPGLKTLYHDIEIPMLGVLTRMERNGVLIDAELLARQSGELLKTMRTVEQQAFDATGESFNIGSPDQIQKILFGKMGLRVISKTPKGAPSTSESVLQELAEDGHELPSLILTHRSLSKLRSTYTEALPKQVNPATGRVHTSYHQAGANTGRLSSSDPNLQNIPIRTPEGRRIRQAFICPESHCLIAADYSQIELRIMAHLSGDESLLSAFAQGEDVHRSTASEIFGVPTETVDKEQRRAAKAINFGLIYGMSAFGLARQLGISQRDAQEYMRLYFNRYPGVKRYMDEIREQAREQGYVETILHRRLYLPDIRSKRHTQRAAAERIAINAPMQGSAADIIKRAMIEIDHELATGNLDAKMIMQVHDELIFETAKRDLDATRAMIVEKMTQTIRLQVPLEVDVGYGSNWDEAH